MADRPKPKRAPKVCKTFSLPADIGRWIEEQAAEQERSQSQVVVRALRHHIRATGGQTDAH